jgi:hypothetical protein
MAFLSEKERQAGTLLLTQFALFNQATVVFEQQIEPAFWKGFDLCVNRMANSLGWDEDADYENKEESWIAPKSWRVEEKTYKYWFECHSTAREGYDFLLALLTRCGTEAGEFGFKFILSDKYFGGVKKRNLYLTTHLTAERQEKLTALKFRDITQGTFFLPIKLDPSLVAACWQENGAFPHEHEVFSPLRDVLSMLEQSVVIFDEIFSAQVDLPE